MSLFANTTNDITLQLSWKNQFQFAGYYIAKEKGYYKDVNLNVTIKEFEYGMDLSNVIENGETDFAVGRSSLLIDRAKGKDIVALYSAFQHSPLVLLVRENSNIKSLQDLKNKRVMLTADAKGTASIIAMLSSNKLYLDDIKLQKHSFNLDDLITGKTDAMGSYISNEPLLLDEKGIKYRIFDPRDYGFEFYSDILFTSASFIKKNPKLTQDFYEATKKGWEYAFNHIGTTSQLIYDKYNSQNKSLIQLVSEGEVLKKLALGNEDYPMGTLEESKLQKIVDVYKVMGLMKKDVNLHDFIYDHSNHRDLYIQFTKEEIIIYSLIAVMSVLIIIFVSLYISVRSKWLHTNNRLTREIQIKTRQLEKQNHRDSLTKARNRKDYDEKIEEYLSLYHRYKNKFSLIMLDIDDFKKINDVYGHKIGDKVLIDLVKIIKSHIRKNDYVFRIGGEEFILLLPQTTLESSIIVAEQLRENIEKELTCVNNEKVTVSFGISEVDEHDNEESLFTRVDTLLYDAKKHGKNRVCY